MFFYINVIVTCGKVQMVRKDSNLTQKINEVIRLSKRNLIS